MDRELVIVLDFGGQYNPKGIILTGGPNSCYEADSPTYAKELFEMGIPVLGLCYGAQLMMHILGGKVERADVREYGKTEVFVDKASPLFGDVSEKTICWMSVRRKDCMQFSSIRKYCTHQKEPRCCIIL